MRMMSLRQRRLTVNDGSLQRLLPRNGHMTSLNPYLTFVGSMVLVKNSKGTGGAYTTGECCIGDHLSHQPWSLGGYETTNPGYKDSKASMVLQFTFPRFPYIPIY